MSRFATPAPGRPLVRHVKFDQLAHLRQYDQDARGLGTAPPERPVPAPRQQRDVAPRTRVRRYGRRPPSSRPPPARHDSVLHQPVALVRRQLDGSVINLSAPTRDARRSVSRATAPGAATGAVAAALTGLSRHQGVGQDVRNSAKSSSRATWTNRHKPGRSGLVELGPRPALSFASSSATISSTSGRVTLHPSSVRPRCAATATPGTGRSLPWRRPPSG